MLKNTTYLFKQTFIASAIAASLSAPSVYAQGETFVMEEVLVTASKREKTLQETPIAVFVTSAETIERANILDTADLTSVVPTLRITPAGTRSATSALSRRPRSPSDRSGSWWPAIPSRSTRRSSIARSRVVCSQRTVAPGCAASASPWSTTPRNCRSSSTRCCPGSNGKACASRVASGQSWSRCYFSAG